MRIVSLRSSLIFAAILTGSASAGPITPGNLAVVRIGGAGGSASAGFIEEYTTSGVLVQTLALPTADGAGGNQMCTLVGGAAAHEGYLSLSTDRRYLVLAGNDIPIGTNVATSALDRVVARVDMAGAIDTTTHFNLSSGWNARSAVMDGNNIWVSGSAINKAVSYTTFGAASATVITNNFGGSRVAKIYNGQLYDTADPNSGNPQGVFSIGAGLPTTTGQTPALLPGFPSTNTELDIWDVWFADPNTIYFADGRAVASGGGVQKWTFNGAAWSRAYTLNIGLGNGVFGLNGETGGGLNTLYCTTADNKIVKITDTGAGSAFTTLVTGVSGNVFRGIVLVPEPASIILIGAAALVFARRR
ncbi:MAG: PEP-CTERM sorting domain-containing protein [Phycisphaerales bacterium]|nr:PEP-CTERM sorting domain-containing protein [Phycisphaerales bacterium]